MYKRQALVILSPERNMTARLEAETAGKLAEYKAGLSNDEILDLVRQTKELKEYQDTPSTKMCIRDRQHRYRAVKEL